MSEHDLVQRMRALDKDIKLLQRHILYCVNNVNIAESRSEEELLQKYFEKLEIANNENENFMEHIKQYRSLIEAAEKRCDELDKQLKVYGVIDVKTDDEADTDEDKENSVQN